MSYVGGINTQIISDEQFRQNLADTAEYYQELIRAGRGARFNGRDISDLTIGEFLSIDPPQLYRGTEVLPFFEAVGI